MESIGGLTDGNSLYLFPEPDADFSDIAVKYFIVLRPGKVSVRGLKHRPDLAPSKELSCGHRATRQNRIGFRPMRRGLRRT